MQHGSHTSHTTSFSEWAPFLVVVLLVAAYLFAVVIACNKKGSWNHWRTISFFFGMVLLAIAVLPALMQWAHTDLRGHMIQHLLIGMFGPLFLVMGAPITLALKVLPVKMARGITAILRSKLFYLLSHPVTALLLNIGGMYLLYLTPLYVKSLSNPYLHYLVHLHFIAAGYLFAWSMIGPEPVPKSVAFSVKVFALFISIAAHAFLSKFMYAHLYPLNSPHTVEQIQQGAKLMYYWGDLSELVLAIALFAVWYQRRRNSFKMIRLS